AHDALLESSLSKAHDESNSQVPKGNGNPNPTVSLSNPLTDQIESLTVESPIPTVSSPVLTACLNDSPEPSSEERLISKRAANKEETPSLDNILSLTNRFEDILGVTTSSYETIGVEANKVWTLVDCPKGVRPIGTKWVLKNKKYKRGIVVRNKARLVDQRHKQEERIDYDEVFAPVARIEAIRLSWPMLHSWASQCTRWMHQVTPKECHLHAVKRIFRYLKGHPKLGLWYPKASPFDLVAFSDSDYGGASQDRKSTTGGSQFLGRRLISWQCKKQTFVATSTTEAEYVAAASCCG
nr:putative ribonuclease H-like domain-containing protein [Tanacetum cinerariifolium]